MQTSWMKLVLVVTVMAHAAAGCGGVRPYRAMAKAASSEESIGAQVDDHRLKTAVREALLASGLGVSITPHVYMGHAYLVGFVDGEAQRQQAIEAARSVEGVRSLDTYLPEKPASGSPKIDDIALEANVKSALALDRDQPVTRIDLEVLAGHVVLLGVVSSPEAVQAVAADTARVSGVSGVTNFLLLPEAEYERRRPGLR